MPDLVAGTIGGGGGTAAGTRKISLSAVVSILSPRGLKVAIFAHFFLDLRAVFIVVFYVHFAQFNVLRRKNFCSGAEMLSLAGYFVVHAHAVKACEVQYIVSRSHQRTST